MKITEFRLKLYPKDFQVIRSFYKDTLGFDVKHEWDREDSKGVMFQVGDTTLEFLWPAEHGIGDAASGSSLSLAVEDVWSLAEELKGKVNVAHEIRDNPWGDTSFGITDPEGYKISFFTQKKEYTESNE